jgi:hypothetical protein
MIKELGESPISPQFPSQLTLTVLGIEMLAT